MSFSYTKDPSNKTNDKVRFLIGDTIKETHLVEDEEIKFALDAYTDNINAACRVICESIAAKFASKTEVRVSNYGTNKDTVYDKYMKLAERFCRKSVTARDFIIPSISVTSKRINIDDEDAVKPFFKREEFDNPQTTTPADKETLS